MVMGLSNRAFEGTEGPCGKNLEGRTRFLGAEEGVVG